MITAGLDLGSGSVKGVLMEDGRRVLASGFLPTRGAPLESARQVLESLGAAANIAPGEVAYLCTPGFGRYARPERKRGTSSMSERSPPARWRSAPPGRWSSSR